MLDIFQAIQKALYEKKVDSYVSTDVTFGFIYLCVRIGEYMPEDIVSSDKVTHEELIAWLEEIRK